MSVRPYDEERAATMLHALRDVKPEQRLDTLAVVIRCWVDSGPGIHRPPHPLLAQFFSKGDSRTDG